MGETISDTQLLMLQSLDPPSLGNADSQVKPQQGSRRQRPPTHFRRHHEWTPIDQMNYTRYNPPDLRINYSGILENLAIGTGSVLLATGIMSFLK
jgi:hypothetical protein